MMEPPVVELYGGIDLGAAATKVVLLDGEQNPRGRAVLPSGTRYADSSREALRLALQTVESPQQRLVRVISTGYGRYNVPEADGCFTEIHCQSVGCFYHQRQGPLTIIDIGGQDTKVIHLDRDGRRSDFKMNRKCAAGTGAFIEEIAAHLALRREQMDGLAARAETAADLNSFCTVFAKTEILAHLRRGTPVEAIVRGAFQAVIQRIREMDSLAGPLLLTGGVVAYNPTLIQMLSAQLGREVMIPPYPQFSGALGAALIAVKQGES
jgi:predicted CoA-substrate-specific enzyme activase